MERTESTDNCPRDNWTSRIDPLGDRNYRAAHIRWLGSLERLVSPHLGVQSMLALQLPMRLRLSPGHARLSAEVTAAAAGDVAGGGAVRRSEQRPGPKRVTVAVETALVGEAVSPWRARRTEAVRHRALEIPRHVGAGALDNLSNALARQPKAVADAREILSRPVTANDLSVSQLDSWPVGSEDAPSLTH